METNHKILSEIKEQPAIVELVIKREHDHDFKDVVQEITGALDRDGQIYLVGSGSSYHSTVFASHLFAKNNYFLSTAIPAGDFDMYVPDLQSKDLIIFVSQSGLNPTILESFHHVSQRAPKTVLITNDNDSPLTTRVDAVLSLEISRERAIPSTKTYLAELAVMSTISEALKDGTNLFQLKDRLSEEIKKICQPDYYSRMERMAQFLSASADLFILGEGIEYANALEAALKFKECALINAEGYLLDEFLHGPCALIKVRTPVILFNSNLNNDTQEKIEKIKEMGAVIICIGGEKRSKVDAHVPVNDFGLFTSLASIVPLQLLAYKVAIEKGLNPDKPEGLSKIVEY